MKMQIILLLFLFAPFFVQSQFTKLPASDNRYLGPATYHYYGYRLTLSDNGYRVAVGAWGYNSGRGAVYVMTRSASTGSWAQEARLTVTTAVSNAYQGTAATISGDGLYVCNGAPGQGNAGTAYVHFFGSSATWSLQATLQPPSSYDALYGTTCAIAPDGSYLFTGGINEGSTYEGAIYLYTRSGTTWTGVQKYMPSVPYAEYGSSISIAADAQIVMSGGPYESNIGAVQLYSRTGASTWATMTKIVSSGSNSIFGRFAEISRDGFIVAIGAYGESSDAGSVSIYTRSGNTYGLLRKFLGSGIQRRGYGVSVAGYALYGNIYTVAVAAGDSSAIRPVNIYRCGLTISGGCTLINSVTPECTSSACLGSPAVTLSADGSALAIGSRDEQTATGAAFTYFFGCLTAPATTFNLAPGPNCPSSFLYSRGSNCTMQCRPGFVAMAPISAFNSFCNESREWTPVDAAICQVPLLPCARPADTVSTIFSGSCQPSQVNNTICTPVCSSTHFTSLSLSRICSNGTYLPSNGVCTPNCNPLFSAAPFRLYGSCTANFPSGQSCTTACNSTHSSLTSGSLTASCSTAGVWTAPTAVCTPLPCPVPANTNSTNYVGGCGSSPLSSGATCSPTCFPGFTASATITLRCTAGVLSFLSSAVCTPNPCTVPVDTLSTSYTSCGATTPSESSCLPFCKIGYTANASLALACSRGFFSDSPGRCLPNGCVRPAATASIVYDACLPTTPSGSVCMPSCTSGYAASPPNGLSILCIAGTFQPSSSLCLPAPCSLPNVSLPLISGGCTGLSSLPSGSSCSLSCAPTYLPSGSLQVSCNFGELSLPSGTCEYNNAADCSQPAPAPPLSPGNCPLVSLNNTSCRLGCISGYQPDSSFPFDFNARCINQQFFYNATASLCLPQACPRPTELPIGMNAGSCEEFTPGNGSSCLPACDSGYSQVGSLSITCVAGVFSDVLGSCLPDPCNPPQIDPSLAIEIDPESICAAQTPSGISCQLRCASGFTPVNPAGLVITCNSGTFSAITGDCLGVLPIDVEASSGSIITITLHPSLGRYPDDVVISNFTLNSIYYPVPFFPSQPLFTIVSPGVTTFRMPAFPLLTSLQLFILRLEISSIEMGLINLPLTEFQGRISFIPTAELKSVCPDKILAEVNQVVVVQADGVIAGPNLRCVLNGQAVFPATMSGTSSVACTLLWLNNTENQIIYLNVANDGSPSVFSSGTQQPLAITVQGACDNQKPGSIPLDDGCVCPPGSFESGGSCTSCIEDYYQTGFGQTSCTPCPSGKGTNGITRSQSISACVCKPGYFSRVPLAETCDLCEVGMVCFGADVNFILPGYWRKDNTSAIVLKCPGESRSCVGSEKSPLTLCGEGYTGVLCNVCEKGYAKVGNTCAKCPPTRQINGFILFLFILLALLMSSMLIRISTFVSTGKDAEESKRLKEKSVGTLCKVTLNFFQLVYLIGKLPVSWTTSTSWLFYIVGQSSLSPQFPSVQCAAQWSFHEELVLVYVSPLIVVTVLTLCYVVRHFFWRMNVQNSVADLVMGIIVILNQIHPTIMLMLVASFPCTSVEGSGRFLTADFSISCDSTEYRKFVSVSTIYIIFYIFGGLAFVFMRMRHNARTEKMFLPSHPAHYRYYFFFRGYTHMCYWWEFVVMTRKLILASLYLIPNVGLQLVYASFVVGASYALTVSYNPFSLVEVMRMERLSLITCYVLILFGFNLELSDPSDDHTASDALLILMISSVGIILVSLCFYKSRDILKRLFPSGWFYDAESEIVMKKIPKKVSMEHFSASLSPAAHDSNNSDSANLSPQSSSSKANNYPL